MNIDRRIIFQDFKPVEITEELRKKVLEQPKKNINYSPRVKMGLFYTDEEKEKYIEDSLKKPLPGDEKKIRTLSFKKNNKRIYID